MYESYELPHDIDMEKEVLSAMLIRGGEAVPTINAILSADDFYRPEHKIIFNAIVNLYMQKIPPDILSVFEVLRKKKDKIEFSYLRSIALSAFTNAYAVAHAKIIKEKSDFRRLMNSAEKLFHAAQQGFSTPAEIIAEHQAVLDEINRSVMSETDSFFPDYFADRFDGDVGGMKDYVDRETGFVNLDEQQYFTPGLYVIGATPAAGKTTFCWQLLEQLARQGEHCIYCTYEMSHFELYAKSLARELFKRDEQTTLTAAQIRRGAHSTELRELVTEFATTKLNLHVFELQDETVDDLLKLLRPYCCFNKTKAPVICLDYLQIMPTGRDSAKLGIDETVRKLKKFQRETNTTFIIISSFNRTNYAQSVSFESFKESGNIEYTADVVWALQLNVLNEIRGGEFVSEMRRKIDEAKKQQPRKIHLKCLKNRQGTNYDCLFAYHSAHDYFEPWDADKFEAPSYPQIER